MKVVLTDQAETDLEEIGDRIARDSPRGAMSFIAELRRGCDGLAANPERFQRVRHSGSQNTRRRVHGNYLIFYRVDRPHITVLRILHGARDHESVSFPDDDAP